MKELFMVTVIVASLADTIGVRYLLAEDSGDKLAHLIFSVADSAECPVRKEKVDDPFRELDLFEQYPDLMARFDDVRQNPPQKGIGYISENSSDAALALLRQSELRAAQLLAFSTCVSEGAAGHLCRQKMLVVGRFETGEGKQIAVVCSLACRSLPPRKEWEFAQRSTRFLKSALVTEWPLREKDLVRFFEESDFGVRDFRASSVDVFKVTSYLQKYEQLNKAFQKPLSDEDRKRYRQLLISVLGKPAPGTRGK